MVMFSHKDRMDLTHRRVYSKTALGGGEEELLDKYTTEETKI